MTSESEKMNLRFYESQYTISAIAAAFTLLGASGIWYGALRSVEPGGMETENRSPQVGQNSQVIVIERSIINSEINQISEKSD